MFALKLPGGMLRRAELNPLDGRPKQPVWIECEIIDD